MTELRFPWDTGPAPEGSEPPLPPAPGTAARPKTPRGRRPAVARTPAAGEGAAPGWLYHHLTAHGPAATLAEFETAARGAGVVPWRHDLANLEEDVFLLAMASPAHRRRLTLDGCRILARQFRTRVEAHQAFAASRVGVSRACTFDLHALLPVPAAVLQLGPDDRRARDWLAAHWGVARGLRHVVRRDGATAGRRLPRGHAVAGWGFFTDGETPQAAVTRLGQHWPDLRITVQPRPLD